MEDRDKPDFQPLNRLQTNQSTPGFVQTVIGFTPPLPNAGTITNTFSFTNDPWNILATDGALLCTLKTIKLSVSKTVNPDNSTQSFLVLSWVPTYRYHAVDSVSAPDLKVLLADENGALLLSCDLGGMETICGLTTTQSKSLRIDPLYFERIVVGVISLGPGVWRKC